MKEIRGDAKNIRALLAGARYAVDYYQREYRWQTKQVAELIEDLFDKFSEAFDPAHDRSAVEEYGHYFLGSIIVSDKDGRKYIIDGQQRLTTLTLLLIFLHHSLPDPEDKAQLADLIFSQRFGKRSFNLDVPERTACMEALYLGEAFEESQQSEAVTNIVARFRDIEEQFPADLKGAALPYFKDWLIENVHLVEITAYSDADAYTIFETMNDRGLSLTPTEMLKGYLLANITDGEARNQANNVWRDRINSLQAIGKEEDADAAKSWLRSQYAESIRERRRGATPRDFDLIGTELHRWVRDNEQALGLIKGSDFARFIEKDFDFFARQYVILRAAAESLTKGLETVHYNAQSDFTLQYPVLLAPLCVSDTEAEVRRKVRVTAGYLDILLARRMWNFKAVDYSAMQYTMFLVIKEIRGRSSADVAAILTARLKHEEETFGSNERFQLHGTNGRQIHRILARMTAYVETQSAGPSRYAEYIRRGGTGGYEIEHIWAAHPEQHQDEFGHSTDFLEYRNRIGGLLLLPKKFNASYGDLPYEEKLPHYYGQNLLARSLHPQCYEHNPGFVSFVEKSGLPFEKHAHFKKAALDQRGILYRRLAETIWDPQNLLRQLET